MQASVAQTGAGAGAGVQAGVQAQAAQARQAGIPRKVASAEGALYKKSQWLGKWKQRYFRLRGRTLCYYENDRSKVARGEIALVGARVAPVELPLRTGLRVTFGIHIKTAKGEEHRLCASDEADRARWLRHMEAAVERRPTNVTLAATRPGAGAETLARTGTGNVVGTGNATQAAVVVGQAKMQSSAALAQEARGQAEVEDEDAEDDEEEAEEEEEEEEEGEEEEVDARFPADFVPPPPPADATDPLSYLMDMSTLQPESQPNPRAATPTKKKMKKKKETEMTEAPPASAPAPASASAPVPASASAPAPAVSSAAAAAPVLTTFLASPSSSAGAGASAGAGVGIAEETDGIGLRNAVKKGDMATVKAILAQDASLSRFQDNQQQTVLHVASMFGHEAAALLLLDCGADATVTNKEGESALEVAPVSLANKMRQRMARIKAATPSKQEEEAEGEGEEV